MRDDPLNPKHLTGLDIPIDRLTEVAQEFVAIRAEIEKLRELDLDETHPAVVFRPVCKDK